MKKFEIELNSRVSRSTVVSIIGAGGKTSLLFYLANEAKQLGKRVLIATTTRMWVPGPHQCDYLDLSGNCFKDMEIAADPAICVTGIPDGSGKLAPPHLLNLDPAGGQFDLILIEADGAAGKRLKGWKETEPVVPDITDKTIGVLDISSIGVDKSEDNIHRITIFNEITRSSADTVVNLNHLYRIITSSRGLFAKGVGEHILYLNKVERAEDVEFAFKIKDKFPNLKVIGGSVHLGEIYV